MPFLRVDAYEGRSKEQVTGLLDAIHRAILSAFGVPPRDRYQVYQEHSEANLIIQDTGLGIERSKNVVFIGITSRQRTEQQKTHLYAKLVEELKACASSRTISSCPSLRTPTRTGAAETDGRSSSPASCNRNFHSPQKEYGK
jgi:hypothetical protein